MLGRMLAAASVFAVAACAVEPAAPVQKSVVYSTDLAGKAASCSATPVTLKDGATSTATMTTSGNGWCGIALSVNGAPYSAGLLTSPAKSGKVYIHTVGDETRIDYTPAHLPVAADSFSVRLLPGDAVLKIEVKSAVASK